MNRLSLLSLAAAALLTSGCELFEPTLGTWELVEVSFGEMSETEVIEGCTLRAERYATLEIDDLDDGELEGEIVYGWSVEPSGSCYGLEGEGDEESFDIEGERDGEDVELEAEDWYEFDCELDGDTLECEDDDGDEWIFERD